MRVMTRRRKPLSIVFPAGTHDANRRRRRIPAIGAVVVSLGAGSLGAVSQRAVSLGACLLLGAFGCQSRRIAVSQGTPHPRQELISEIKDFENQVGFQTTKNFSRHSDKTAADYRCYYTGKLELPDSYEKLRLKGGTRDGCRVKESKYDVFFYALEAAASGNTAVTVSLSEASPERVMVVVPHEDFHNDKQLQKLPAAMSEAASTLVGFLTASEFALEKFGAGSPEHTRLAQEAQLFLAKAELVNAYHSEISALYAAHGEKRITRREALAKKEELFDELEVKCRAILPKPVSFNSCPAVGNNAGLAFDRTYTERYPLLHKAFTAKPRGLAETIQRLRELANDQRLTQSGPDSMHAIVAAILDAE